MRQLHYQEITHCHHIDLSVVHIALSKLFVWSLSVSWLSVSMIISSWYTAWSQELHNSIEHWRWTVRQSTHNYWFHSCVYISALVGTDCNRHIAQTKWPCFFLFLLENNCTLIAIQLGKWTEQSFCKIYLHLGRSSRILFFFFFFSNIHTK
jgi:hypothetical protein